MRIFFYTKNLPEYYFVSCYNIIEVILLKTYNVTLINGNPTADTWNSVPTALLDIMHYPAFPSPYRTEGQLVYNDRALYVHMKTTERKIRAYCSNRNDEVCEDSCMEFFIAPDSDDIRYFNFEINAIGTLLLYVCNKRIEMVPTTDDARIFNIKSIISNDGWELFYEIPFSFMTKYFNKISPTMIANFYKCGEKTEPRHFSAWNKPQDAPSDVHRPEDFGLLIFEGK